MIKIHFFQPLVPEYRISLFRSLFKNKNFFIKISASHKIPGINNLCTIENCSDLNLDLNHPCISFLNNSLFWQRNLHIDASMGNGDVIIISGNLRFISNIPLIFEAKRKKIKIIWWAHGFSKQPKLIEIIIHKIIFSIIDIRLLYTEKEIQDYTKLGFPSNKLHATNNAIDYEPIKKAKLLWSSNQLNEFRHNQNLKDKKVLLFCGRNKKSVSLDLLITSIAKIRKTFQNIFLVIIGTDDSEGPLGIKSKELMVNDCIRWIGPVYDQNLLAPWFLISECFVFPGPIGLSLMHAFSYGLPVIVPQRLHKPEIAVFYDGVNGFFYKDGDLIDLSEKIISVISNEKQRKKFSENAFTIIQTKYNMENMVNRFSAAIYAAIKN